MNAPKKTKKMLAIEAKHGKRFWQIVDSMARRGCSKAEVADFLGFTHSHFYRLVAKHPDPIEWNAPHETRRAVAERRARRGVCTPALREAMDRARAVQRESCLYKLHGFTGTVTEHAARQGVPMSTVSSRRKAGWTLSEALGYVPREADKRGYAVRRVEREYGEPFIDVLRGFAAQNLSTHYTAQVLEVCHDTVMYHVKKAGGRDALGFKAYVQPPNIDRGNQQASWLKTKGRMLTHDGRTQHLNAWAEETGIGSSTIAHRIDRCGWTVSDALTIPVGARRQGFTKQRPARDHKWRQEAACSAPAITA